MPPTLTDVARDFDLFADGDAHEFDEYESSPQSDHAGTNTSDTPTNSDTPTGEAHSPKTDGKKRWSWPRRILTGVGVLAVLGLIAGLGFGAFINQTASSNVTTENLLGDPSPSIPAVPGTGQNILLIGSDARPDDKASRSDVILLAHITEAKDKVYLISFPRDLYVDIPGKGKNKINAAYAFGGAPLLVSTLQQLLGVKIDHVAKTDFEGFKRMTNAVDGVQVWVEEPSTATGSDGKKYTYTKGWNSMDGDSALAFVRQRKELSEGDISRGRRQQAFLKALMVKTMKPATLGNPVKAAQLVNAGTKDLVIDETWSVDQIRSTGWDMRNVRGGDIYFITAPFTGFADIPGVGSVDVVDKAKMKRLATALQEDKLDSYQDVNTAP